MNNTVNGAQKSFSKKVRIKNELGLHARPASMLIKVANQFMSEITIQKGSETVNGKSIMGVMMLAAGKGAILHITAVGHDAEQAVLALEEVIDSKFGED